MGFLRKPGSFFILSDQRGQAVLIVVLIMVVALTAGLSVASRAITNLRISTDEENSQRAFSAAEAGVEAAVKKCAVAPCQVNDVELAAPGGTQVSSYSYNTTFLSGTEFLVNGGNAIEKDDGVDVWLIDHNADNSLSFDSGWHASSIPSTGSRFITVYWGSGSVSCTGSGKDGVAALEVIVLSGDQTSPVVTRYAVDPCQDRRGANSFSASDSNPPSPYTVGNKDFLYKYTIILDNASKGVVVRLVPLYASSSIGVLGCDHPVSGTPTCYALPGQGKVIESTGKSGSSFRKVTFFQGYPVLPSEFFQYGVFWPNQ